MQKSGEEYARRAIDILHSLFWSDGEKRKAKLGIEWTILGTLLAINKNIWEKISSGPCGVQHWC